MKSNRCPSEIAEQIREIVPEEHKNKLDRLIRNFGYKAPEMKGECWLDLSLVCNDILSNAPPVHEWQFEMLSVLTTRSIEELKTRARRHTTVR